MKKLQNYCRIGGIAAAMTILVTPLSGITASADGRFTGNDISECQYVCQVGKKVTTSDAAESNGIASSIDLSCSEIGVKGTDTITELWISYTGEAGKKVMPAIGYYAPGFGEYDWYSDSVIVSEGKGTVIFDIPEEPAMPDQFTIQNWWGDIDTFTVDAVGFKTKGASTFGSVTRLGDCNLDKTVSVADAVVLSAFLTQGKEFQNPANGDMDKSGTLDARDLVLLKAAIIQKSSDPSDDPDGFNQTAMEFVSNIKLGWNLGNTLDATSEYAKSIYDFETCWGCPYTTKAMITAVKDAGFNTVRVPVSWGQKMDAQNNVSDEWMNRVQEVVDYVIDSGMYCILNSHHDTDWQRPRKNLMDSECAKLKSLWTQIANRFKDYDAHLIFETLNEPRLVGDETEWSGGDAEARQCINTMNATALSAIRATGGNNEKRFVMMPGHGASPMEAVLNDIVLPDDDHLIVSAHAYAPYNFALNTAGTAEWDENSGSYDIVANFKLLKSKFIDKGVPVIIGEFGALNKNNESTRAKWAEYYVKTADAYGIPCIWWDNNAFNGNGENFGLLNRGTCQIQFPEIMAALLRGAANRG